MGRGFGGSKEVIKDPQASGLVKKMAQLLTWGMTTRVRYDRRASFFFLRFLYFFRA